MKKLLLLILVGFSLTTVNAQDDLPKVIQDINKTIFNISRDIHSVNANEFTPNKWTKHKVWIHNNQIKKIRFEENLANASTTTDFFFNYGRLISVKYFFTAYGSRGFKNQRKVKDSTVSRDSYFNYDELISNDYLIYEGKDTLFWGVRMQEQAYSLFDKYKTKLNYNPYKTLEYDSVVAYDFKGEGGGTITDGRGKLDRTAKNATKLTTQQIDTLIETITDTASYGGFSAACFDPHMGIVFYKSGKVVSKIDICFGCNFLVSSEILHATAHHLLRDFKEDYMVNSPRYGFTPLGRKKLRTLCAQLGLKYCPKEDTIWDKKLED